MASEKTANYSLPQWAYDDQIRMDDFNAAFSTIDETIKSTADTAARKADSTALTEEAQTRAGAITALTKNLGAAGHNARIAWGSYVGDSTAGADHPTGVSVPFYPVLLFVVEAKTEGTRTDNPVVFLRPNTASTSTPEGTTDSCLIVRWTGTGVSWYTPTSTKGSAQLNGNGNTYVWVAIGYDKSVEESA